MGRRSSRDGEDERQVVENDERRGGGVVGEGDGGRERKRFDESDEVFDFVAKRDENEKDDNVYV
jgi:hypothetical protein